MAIGLGALRAAGRRRSGRSDQQQERARTTVREVCLVGLDRRSSARDWPAGQEVTWLGRKYQVVGTAPGLPERAPASLGGADAGSVYAPARRYVHLAPCGGD